MSADLSPDLAAIVERWQTAKAEAKAAADDAKAAADAAEVLRRRLLAACPWDGVYGPATIVTLPGKQRWDDDALEAHLGDAVDKFRRTGEPFRQVWPSEAKGVDKTITRAQEAGTWRARPDEHEAAPDDGEPASEPGAGPSRDAGAKPGAGAVVGGPARRRAPAGSKRAVSTDDERGAWQAHQARKGGDK